MGKIVFVNEPRGPWIRNDSGIYSGIVVSMYYDPILAKLIVWGENRQDASVRLNHALRDYIILGIKTQIPFLKQVIEHPEFIKGNTNTNFIQNYFSEWRQSKQNERLALAVAAINSYERFGIKQPTVIRKTTTPWLTIGNWEISQS